MLDKISKVLKASDRIAILPHISADGDAIGSSLALALALNGMKKNSRVILEEKIPFVYGFLPDGGLSAVFHDMGKQNARFDTVVAVDCGDIERLGGRKEIFGKAPVTVNIDHHPTNTSFAEYNFIDAEAAATAEIIYRLLGLLDVKAGRDTATCLYTAIAADTGGFRYGNTTPLTHKIAAELIKSGVDVAQVSERIFDSVPYEKVKLTGAAIDTLELIENGRIAVMALTRDLIQKTGAGDEDFDGIINTARSIRGVDVAAMLRQTLSGEIKVSLRSNSRVDVSEIARAYSGGGHKKAAGYTADGTLAEAKDSLINSIRKVL